MSVDRQPQGKFQPNPKLKLREQLGEVMRYKHFSHRTESAYWHWIKGFIRFHRRKATPHPPAQWNSQYAAPHPAGGHLLPRAEKEPCPTEAEREVGWRHPWEMGAPEVQAYLSHLAVQKDVAAATRPP